MSIDKSYLRNVGGTLLYSSPESMSGKAVKRSDYFSAGMILFAMCCNNDFKKITDFKFA